jgi:hypothetical protein
MEQVAKSQRDEMLRTQKAMAETRDKLAHLQASNRERGRVQKTKKLFMHPDRPLDIKGFEERAKGYHERRVANLQTMKGEETAQLQTLFHPTINEESAKMTLNRPHFHATVDAIIQKSKSQAPNRLKVEPGPRSDSKEETFPRQIRDLAIQETNSKMYEKNIQWKEEKDERVFEAQVAQNLVKEKIPHFTPALNHQKNARIVKSTFEERSAEHPRKVQAKINQLSKTLHDYPFEPKILPQRL